MEDGGSFILICVESGYASEMGGGHVGRLRVSFEQVVPHVLPLFGDPE